MGADEGKEGAVRVLAIDPGPIDSAWVIWDGMKIDDHGKCPNGEIISLLSDREDFSDPCHIVAIEMIASYGMPVGKEVFETCVWIGRFQQTAENRGMPVELIPRREVKLHLCNSVRAKDANVRQALIDKVGPQGKKASPGPTYGIKADEWAALGLAVTALHQEICGAF
jgi:hypothetical protein